MLFYIKCPTCSRVLSKNFDKYNKDRENIVNNNALSNQEKDIELSKLLDKYQYRKMCCRIRIMGYIPYHLIIQS